MILLNCFHSSNGSFEQQNSNFTLEFFLGEFSFFRNCLGISVCGQELGLLLTSHAGFQLVLGLHGVRRTTSCRGSCFPVVCLKDRSKFIELCSVVVVVVVVVLT